MALVQTTPAQILKRIRTHDVWGEMQLLFMIAEGNTDAKDTSWMSSNKWFYEESWDRQSFGVKTGKKMITFKSAYDRIDKIIEAHARGKYVSLKIARVKKSDEPKFGRSIDSGKPYIFLNVGSQLIKFQGTKATSGSATKINATTKTKMQEIGSAYVFYLALCEGGNWSTWDKLYEDPRVIEVLGKGVWPHFAKNDDAWEDDGQEWCVNFWIQQKALLSKLGGGNCLFDRYIHSAEAMKFLPHSNSNAETFMEYITKIVGDLGVKGKDNWNPADIWLIDSKSEAAARDSINKILFDKSVEEDVKRLQVNHLMRGYFNSHKIFGISLKKVTKDPASIVYFNHKEEFFTDNWVGKGYTGKGTDDTVMKYSNAICKMGLDEDNTLETQDTWFIVNDTYHKGATYKFQIKANNSSEMSGLKYEATAEGHGDARLGKATVDEVIKAINHYSTSSKMLKEKEKYAQNCDQFQKQNVGSPNTRGWQHTINYLWDNKTKFNIDFGSADSKEECYSNLCIAMTKSIEGTKPHVVNSKLQQIRWLYCFFNGIKDSDKDRFSTKLVWLSMKAGRDYGPFAKIY